MNTPTLTALLGFIGWTLSLLVIMEVVRTKLVLLKQVKANGFDPENSTLSPFMQRLARAFANCLEGLVLFGSLMAVAIMTSQTAITDGLALVFLGARIVQSVIHLISTSSMAVTMRFTAFGIQMGIAIYWCYQLLMVTV